MSRLRVDVRRSLHRPTTKAGGYSVLRLGTAMEWGTVSAAPRTDRYGASQQDLDHLLAIIDSQQRALTHRAQIILDLQKDVETLGKKLLEERGKTAHFSRLYTQSEKELKTATEKLCRLAPECDYEELSMWNSECVAKTRENGRKKTLSIERWHSSCNSPSKEVRTDTEETKAEESTSFTRSKVDLQSEELSVAKSTIEKLRETVSALTLKCDEKSREAGDLQCRVNSAEKNCQLLEQRLKASEQARTDLLQSVELFRKKQEAEFSQLKAATSHNRDVN